MVVRIVSGWSAPGGSTVAFINLTNLLNDNGIEAVFYGPQDWHLDKCKGEPMNNFTSGEDDVLICHFVDLKAISKLKAAKKYLYCHETNLYPLAKMELRNLDAVVFVSNSQKKWHSVNYFSVIIPPVVKKVDWEPRASLITAGVIGSIDAHKRTHLAIERALIEGAEKVLLYGEITDYPYFNEFVSPYVNSGKAALMGHEDDRSKMYNSIDKAFIASERETFGLVHAECKVSRIPCWVADTAMSNGQILEDSEILEKWQELLN